MKEPTPALLQEATSLIDSFRGGDLNDEELSDITSRLDEILPDPHWFSYLADQGLAAEEIVHRAFQYRPIEL